MDRARESPYGYVDWWPHSLYVNNEVAPWSDKNVRWALSYYIDRSTDRRNRLVRCFQGDAAATARLSTAEALLRRHRAAARRVQHARVQPREG